jgi:hypothetical protein
MPLGTWEKLDRATVESRLRDIIKEEKSEQYNVGGGFLFFDSLSITGIYDVKLDSGVNIFAN